MSRTPTGFQSPYRLGYQKKETLFRDWREKHAWNKTIQAAIFQEPSRGRIPMELQEEGFPEPGKIMAGVYILSPVCQARSIENTGLTIQTARLAGSGTNINKS